MPPLPKAPGQPYGRAGSWSCAICLEGKVGEHFTVADEVKAAFDGDPATAWCAPADAASLEVVFPGPRILGDVDILGGHFETSESLARHGRVKTLRVAADGAAPAETLLHDPTWIDFQFARSFPASALGLEGAFSRARVEVAEAFPGDVEDVCIAELTLNVGEVPE